MSYNNFPSIGVPTSGFGSRGKGANIKRLSFEPSSPATSQDNGAPTPRTSRSHLLAGLRTAPKSATSSTFPPSAPPTQLQHRVGLDNSIYSDNKENARSYGGPKTSIASSFSTQGQQSGYNNSRQMYSLPEQPLAPPEILVDEHGQDPNLYAQLVATNIYLAEQQQRLQQQIMNVHAAQQQFQGMNMGGQVGQQMQQQFATPPVTPNMGMYQQQVKQNMQPIVTPVMGGQPGLYSVYNPMTGQQSYFIDQNAQQGYESQQQRSYNNSPPQQPGTPRFQVSPPTNGATPLRSISPPKKSVSPPQDHSPLPPPSANAFRRGHKKSSSLANVVNVASTNPNLADGGPRTSIPKTAGFPATPMTGTFGPGAARAGEHPIRQPRGPPSLDELKEKPTTKFEGSKNFATRQRRSAVHNLVRAGMERRRAPGSGSGSAGSITPISEHGEISFSISSDNDSDSGRSGSGSLSGRPSLGSSRTSAHGAIGSERPSSRQKNRSQERGSVDSTFTTASISSDEGSSVGGSFAAVFKNGSKKPEASELVPRKAPMLVLTSAEKRKSSVF
jgi:hypothetical protein